MDATTTHPDLARREDQEGEQPMSAELMRKLHAEGAVTIPELQRIMGLAESSVYRYFEHTELRFGQLLAIFLYARSDRVRELILGELLPGSGYQVVALPDALDADGDGDVDTDDATDRAINAVGLLHKTLKALRAESDQAMDPAKLHAMRESFIGLVEEATAGLAVIDWLIKQSLARPRRQARPVLNGHPRKAVRP